MLETKVGACVCMCIVSEWKGESECMYTMDLSKAFDVIKMIECWKNVVKK